VLQRLLTATCCARGDDGVWGPKTQESLTQLRSDLGLDEGGLDSQLWEAVLGRPPVWSEEIITSVVGGLPIPTNAVLLSSAESSAAHYLIAAATTRLDVYSWFSDAARGKDFAPWQWCSVELGPATGDVTTLKWWQETGSSAGPLLTLVIRDMGAGRVDIRIAETGSATVSSCSGYQKSEPTETASGSTESHTTATTRAPKPNRSLSDLFVSSDRYRYDDDGVNWKWRPTGTYVNRSNSRIIYAEVVWYIEDIPTGQRVKYWEPVETEIPAGGSIDIMRGLWFPLSILDTKQQYLGVMLGGSTISIYSEVRYIMYEDYTTVGTPV